MTDLFARAHAALMESDVAAKLTAVDDLRRDWQTGALSLSTSLAVEPIADPGRPQHPQLVSPLHTERRSAHTVAGRAVLIHALAHIEFNAINLALDAVYRFRDLPSDYYRDWLQVGAEEAYHFQLLRAHLQTLDHDYGEFTAHDGLWQMAVKTAHDPLVRMALVPRVLEARGLDASPGISKKLAGAGDARAVEILEIIQRDEIGHVAIGTRWYTHLCAQRGLNPLATFRALLCEFDAPRMRPPFAVEARRAAGFSEQELQLLEDFAAAKKN
jgi:uncharacterized ferritin-like protein (DUF455 family)